MDDESRTYRQTLQLAPLPAGTLAWIVWGGETAPPVVEGPFPVAAVAVVTEIQTATGGDGFRPREQEGVLEYARTSFLVLAPNCGEWEGPWIEHSYVFFSQEAAEEAAADREKSRQRRLALVDAQAVTA